MRTELPVLKRCCFCVPLRYGLITWGYLRLVTAILVFIGMSLLFQVALERVYLTPHKNHTFNATILGVILIVMVADIVLILTFIIGGHMKNLKMLRIYYVYNIVLWILATLMGIISAITMFSKFKREYIDLTFQIWVVLVDLCTLLVHVLIQGYFLLLVRSEIIKLRSNCQFRFVNNAAESECAMKSDKINGEEAKEYCEGATLVSD